MNEARYEELVVKVVDHTATPAEREELMSWLVDQPDKRQELEAQQALKALTDGWVARLEHDLEIDRHEQSPAWQLETGLGLLLLLGATVAVSAGTLYELWLDPEAPLWLTLGMSLGAAGCVVLLAAVIRWRMRAHDPYSEVIR